MHWLFASRMSGTPVHEEAGWISWQVYLATLALSLQSFHKIVNSDAHTKSWAIGIEPIAHFYWTLYGHLRSLFLPGHYRCIGTTPSWG